MSYNARLRATQKRATGNRGWEVGSNASLGVGIPSRLVRTVSERTTPMTWVDGELKDDRNLVVQQNTLSGVGRYRSQFNVNADGIKSVRYYLDNHPSWTWTHIEPDIILIPAPSSYGTRSHGTLYDMSYMWYRRTGHRF